jgi:hypothetical protein
MKAQRYRAENTVRRNRWRRSDIASDAFVESERVRYRVNVAAGNFSQISASIFANVIFVSQKY